MANHRPRFDIKALRDIAGEKVFARGKAYHAEGAVVVLDMGPARVLAQVEGTETYRTELTGQGKTIGGTCSCPAVVDWGFCKHMVATALAANELGPNDEATGALDRIRDHLRGRDVETLVEMIVEQALRDPVLFQKLERAATMKTTDDKTLEKRLRKALDQATRVDDSIDFYGAGTLADGVAETLDVIAALLGEGRGKLVLDLTRHAIDRIEHMIERIDDSDDECFPLLARARDIHLAAARASRPDPVELARELFAREMDDEFGIFTGALVLYEDVLGAKGRALYRGMASEAWAKLPPRTNRSTGEQGTVYDTLRDILDVFADRENDVATRIALRAKDLSSPWRYFELATFCAAMGRDDEALRRAEEGLWMFEDGRPDERLVAFTVDGLVKAGRPGDAEAVLWKAFRKMPSLALHQALCKVGGADASATAIAFLEARLREKGQTAWGHPADLLIQVLIHERKFDAAWPAVREHGASKALKHALAKASEATHARDALAIYAEHVEDLVVGGGNSAYDEATKLIGRMARLRSVSEQAAYVEALKTRFGRKRNFMKLLA